MRHREELKRSPDGQTALISSPAPLYVMPCVGNGKLHVTKQHDVFRDGGELRGNSCGEMKNIWWVRGVDCGRDIKSEVVNSLNMIFILQVILNEQVFIFILSTPVKRGCKVCIGSYWRLVYSDHQDMKMVSYQREDSAGAAKSTGVRFRIFKPAVVFGLRLSSNCRKKKKQIHLSRCNNGRYYESSCTL